MHRGRAHVSWRFMQIWPVQLHRSLPETMVKDENSCAGQRTYTLPIGAGMRLHGGQLQFRGRACGFVESRGVCRQTDGSRTEDRLLCNLVA